MNLIAGSLLYHAEEYISFWLLKLLINKLNLRELYIDSNLL